MEAYIVGGVRTAIGRFNGALASLSAPELGAIALRELLARAAVDAAEVGEVILGNVIQAGLGQNPARQAAIRAGLPPEVPSFSVNKVCGSGLKSVALAGQAVSAGEASMIVAGGMEHMSGAPYLLKTARWGQRMGHGELVDALLRDALWDAFYDCHMGVTAENVAEKYGIARAEQDAFALRSQRRAAQAMAEGRFRDEIVAITIRGERGAQTVFDRDEHPRPEVTAESLAKLKPAFRDGGTVTAGNASGINDGAAAVLVVSAEKMKTLGAPWAFKIVASHAAGLDPAYMGLGPICAARGVLKKAGCTVRDLELIEVNEAFAAQSIQVQREMGWDPERLNVLGGAIALGHPVGASGTRILVTLLHEMVRRDLTVGLAALCIGGGQGMALLVERVR
jgi:acetyl-CoA C-acetyltransferase